MKEVYGNLIELAEDGKFDVLCHGANCFNRMGSGIAKQLVDRYPDVYIQDNKTIEGDRNKLGTFTYTTTPKGFHIANLYTQYSMNKKNEEFQDHFSYYHFPLALERLFNKFESVKYGFPLIGCGLAGGNEYVIRHMLETFSKKVERLGGSVTLVLYNP